MPFNLITGYVTEDEEEEYYVLLDVPLIFPVAACVSNVTIKTSTEFDRLTPGSTGAWSDYVSTILHSANRSIYDGCTSHEHDIFSQFNLHCHRICFCLII